MKREKIIIAGAGLAGSLLASCLANKGYEIEVFERRPDMRKGKIEGGRSINLSLSNRGINALQKVNMAEQVLKEAIPMHGRMMHDVEGKLAYQAYGMSGQYINSVSRGGLNLKLIQLADTLPNVTLHFNHKVLDANFEDNTIHIEGPNGETIAHTADAIIATDGAFSPIRLAMQKTNRFTYSQTYENYGYKELHIAPDANGDFKLEKNALHIWPRGDFMMIALPNPDGSFTCTLFLPYEGPESFEKLDTTEAVNAFFTQYFADSIPMIEDLEANFFKNPTASLVTVRCNPWVRGKMALLGDAAHAIVPFYGQGMNAAFEDVAVLDSLIDQMKGASWNEIFNAYQAERIPNAYAIADLALQNFVEMRDLVGKKEFLDFKRVEHTLCEKYPDLFKSQYELVTFSNVSYQTALKSGEKNARFIHYILEHQFEEKLNEKDWVTQKINDFSISYT